MSILLATCWAVSGSETETTGGETGGETTANGCTVDGCTGTYENGFCSVCGDYEAAKTDDDGTYLIANAGQLYRFAQQVSDGNREINGKLTADITVNENVLNEDGTLNGTPSRTWTPIGIENYKSYKGTFDGDGHTISGLYFNDATATYGGLFGYVDEGTVKNVGVVDSFIYGKSYVGGVVGYISNGAVENCYNAGSVGGAYQGNAVGGVVGYFQASSVGNLSTVKNCYNTGLITGHKYVGGVIGEIYLNGNGFSVYFTNLYNSNKVSGYTEIGGVVGRIDSTISSSQYYNSDLRVYAKITGCYSTGEISASHQRWPRGGGLIGYIHEYTTVKPTNCYYLADVATGGVGEGSYEGEVSEQTTEAFASGQVTYLLNDGKSDDTVVWRQNLSGTDKSSYPSFVGHTVIKNEDDTYTNDAHVYTDGICTICGAECPHDSVTGGFCTLCGEKCTHTDENGDGICDDCGLVMATEPTKNSDGVYEIWTADQLYWFADQVNSGENSINGKLMADIVIQPGVLAEDGTLNTYYAENADKVTSWTPIGNNSNRYAGTFDGDGYSISGLYFNDSTVNYVGLFGNIDGATVKNVGVKDSYIQGNNYVGGVVGNIYSGTVTGCTNTGTVSGKDHVGGVVGYNSGTVTGCTNSGTVTGTGDYVGGVVGNIYSGTVTGCTNAGTVSGKDHVGGVSGYNNTGTVTNCYNTGNVSGKNYVGGVVGTDFETVTGCTNSGTVTGTNYVGGVVGYNTGTVTGCSNTGTVSGNNDVGGVVGYAYAFNNGEITIENCYNTGTVSGTSNVGGVAGKNNSSGTVTNCYYLGTSETDEIDGTTFKTKEQFASGEVAYLLNGDQTTIVWKQTIGKDSYPNFSGSTVYTYTNCKGEGAYSNEQLESNVHLEYVNGFCTLCGGYQPATQNSDGEYEIGNLGQLMWFAQKVNAKEITSHSAILTADITIDNSVVWTPIELPDKSDYASTFDGNGHTITFANTKEDSTFGLFSRYNYSTIKNLYLAGSITCNQSDVTGVLVNSGYRTTIKNVISTVSIENSGSGSTGGLAGKFGGKNNQALIQNCAVYADVKSAGRAGGLIGENWGGTQYCYVKNSAYVGDVTGSVQGAIMGYNGLQSNLTSYFTSVYYCEKDGISYCGGTYGGTITLLNVESRTSEEFASGEVAYLLNGSTNAGAWKQTLDTDSYPNFSGEDVYYGYVDCTATEKSYSNSKTSDISGHQYNENGFCKGCGGYEQPKTDTDGVYLIDNAGKLYWFAQQVNAGNTAICGKLTADITVNKDLLGSLTYDDEGNVTNGEDFRKWTPIGNYDNRYTGTFDGNNKYISGLYFNDDTKDYVGLFGYVNGGTVKNVTVKDSYIRGSYYVGGVVGENDGTVTNCYNTGTVSGVKNYVGGVIGRNYSTVTGCSNFGAVTGTVNYVGGVVGYSKGTVTNCYNTGAVSGVKKYVGGVVGRNGGTVTGCSNFGAVTGTGSYAGGVVGYNSRTVTNCYNIGTVSGKYDVGGVVGYNDDGTVTNCYYLDTCGATGDYGTSKTAEQFASGEVAWLLNGGVTDGTQVWYQKLGEGGDAYPNFTSGDGRTVYYSYSDCVHRGYSNINVQEPLSHAYVNGFCTGCGGYQPCVQDESGTYLIGNAGQFYWFAAEVNSGSTDICGKLTENITVNKDVLNEDGTLNGTPSRTWTPIGNTAQRYSGTFDGDGHSISGLYFNDSTVDYVGLFGYVNTNCTVKNVTVKDSYISGKNYVGGVVGFNYARIVTNCSNTGSVSGTENVGGVVGYSIGAVTNCSNSGTVSGTDYYVGGVVGYNNSKTVTNCSNSGAVSGTTSVGGVVAYNGGTVTNCSNSGSVSGNKNVGGVAGWNDGTVTNCYYLNTSAGKGIGSGDGKATAKTAEQFASGEVTSLLNGGVTDGTQVWYQKLGEDGDETPNFTEGYTVYGGYAYDDCSSKAGMIYQNSKYDPKYLVDEKPEHSSYDRTYTSNGDGTHKVVCNTCGETIDEAEKCVLNPDGSCSKQGCGYQCPHTNDADNDKFCDDCGASTEAAIYNAEEGYYEIYNVAQLYWFAQQVNSGKTDIAAKLMNDITVNPGTFNANGEYTAKNSEEVRAWTPICNTTDAWTAYYANFDGNGYTVSGLYCKVENGNAGFFGKLGYYAVTNLHIANSYFEGEQAGAIAGYGDAQLEKCSVGADVFVVGSSKTGGLIGNAGSGSLKNCYSLATVTGGVCGGLVGYNAAQISNCFTTAMQPVGINVTNYGSLTNVYYAEDTRDYTTPDKDGYTPVKPTFEGATEITNADDFTSGKLAWLLQNGVKGELEGYDGDGNPIYGTAPEIWGQNLGTDSYPNFTGDTVYKKTNTGCQGSKEERFSNTDGETFAAPHAYDNGFCTNEGCTEIYEPAVLNNGVYEISNAGQLYWFAAQVNGGKTSINGKLTTDIIVNSNVLNEDGSLNGTPSRTWTPIGHFDNKYTGTFDGNGKTISGLYFNDDTQDGVGLFEQVAENGTVKNVAVIDSYFCGKYIVGGVVGANEGTVTECSNSGTVSGSYKVGGVAGENQGTVTGCYNTGVVSGKGDSVGGVAGHNYKGTVTSCYNTGAVSGTSNVGGVVGYNESTVTNCYYLGTSETNEIDGTTYKTAEQFLSGEVTWLLSGESADGVWKQNLNGTNYPNFADENKVYYGYTSCADGAEADYTNSEAFAEKPHDYDANGFCTKCEGETHYQPCTGEGTETSPYLIANAGNLYWFAAEVKGGNNAIWGKLVANITVNSSVLNADGTLKEGTLREWTPIGNTTRYSGTFDGNGKTVSGLYVDSTSDYVGLFGCISGTVKNVAVQDSYIKSTGDFVGGVVGDNRGKVINCCNFGTVSGKNMVGGVVGFSNATYSSVTSCFNIGTVTGTGSSVGGVVGGRYRNATVTNCYYLDTCGATGHGIGTSVTAGQFASGEVAWLLNGSTSEGDLVWKQTIGTDASPNFTGKTVYYDAKETPQYYNEKIASVTIVWTDMSFTYDKGTWNTDTMTWEGGGWVADEGCGTVTVANTGNVAVNAQFGVTFTDDSLGISVSFTENDVLLDDKKLKVLAGEKKTVTVNLTGNEPSEYIKTAQTIGQITITLSTE